MAYPANGKGWALSSVGRVKHVTRLVLAAGLTRPSPDLNASQDLGRLASSPPPYNQDDTKVLDSPGG